MANVREAFLSLIEDHTEDFEKEFETEEERQILSDLRRLSYAAVKRRTEHPSRRHRYELIQAYPILQRELGFWEKQLMTLMKIKANLSKPWVLTFSRNLPDEVFCLFKCMVREGDVNAELKETKHTWTCYIKTEDDLRELFKPAINKVKLKTKKRKTENQNEDENEQSMFLEKSFGQNGFTKVICNMNKPFIIKYSFSKEAISVTCSYGCWNRFMVPQHY